LPRTLLAFGDDGTSNPFCAHVNGYDEVLHWSSIDDVAEFSEGTMDAFRARWLTHQSRIEPREVLGSCRQKAYDPLPGASSGGRSERKRGRIKGSAPEGRRR
jgi:hypothetical protein